MVLGVDWRPSLSSFRFVHAADLHLGSPFAGLARADAEIAARFARATREAFSDLVEKTIALGAAFMVIAGDVYDGEWKDASIGLFFARELGRLERAGVAVALLKGNHDAESVVTRTVSLPESVRQFSARKPETIRLDQLKVALHGQSFAERAARERLALAYPDAVPGWFNIGVLHTCGEGSTAHAPYAPCTVEELRLRGYDYWALGHIHEHAVLARDPWVVFPGNLQGRSVKECGAKGAVVVDVEDGRVAAVERLVVDKARWAHVEVDLTGAATEAEAFRLIEGALTPALAETDGRLTALRLTLSGATPLHGAVAADPRRFADEAQALAQRSHHDVWLEKLKLELSPPPRPAGAAPEVKSLDLAALLDGLEADEGFAARAREIASLVSDRLPAGAGGDELRLAEDIVALAAEARALAIARARG